MNNKVKQVLVLLFVVSTLLIMIGSVSANTDNLNENLEASNTLNDDLSVVPDVDSGADEDVSNQLTISNIDEQTNGSSSLGESNSENVVSNYEDTTIYAKDSDNNIIKASNEGDDVLTDSSRFIITNTALNPYAKDGDIVTFHVFGRNVGGDFDGNPLEIGFDYNKDQLDFVSFTPGINSEAPSWYDAITHYNLGSNPNPNFDMNPNGLLVGYDCSDFKFANGFLFNFTASFRVKSTGTLETTAFMWHDSNVKSKAQTLVENPADLTITYTALNPYANVGDEVKFEIYVVNKGGTYDGMYDQESNVHFVGLNLGYNSNQLDYVGYTPTAYPGNYLSPKNYPSINLVQFGYRIWDEGFKNDYNFKFTVTFKVKNPGTLKTNVSVIGFDSASGDAQVDVADFRMTVTPSNTVIVNKGDEVNFNIVVTNYGGTFYPEPFEGYRFVGINFGYNSNVLEYAGYTPGKNPFDGNYYAENYLVPKINPRNNLAQFAYNISEEGFRHMYCFNFTVTFNVLDYGTSVNSIAITQYPNVSKSVTVNSKPVDITITDTPSAKTMRVGDVLAFDYVVKNQGSRYNGDHFTIDIDFDADKLKYMGFMDIPNLSGDSVYYTSAHDSTNPVLGAVDGDVLGADSSVGHLKLSYASPNGFDEGESFNFKVLFTAAEDGKLRNTAKVSGDQLATSRAYGVAYAGDPSLKLTKTPDSDFKDLGDTVDYEIFLENNGTLHYTDKNYIELNDYYHLGLVYKGFTVNSVNEKGEPVKLHVSENVTSERNVHIIFDLIENGFVDENGLPEWAPGSSLNITLHFSIHKKGVTCNFIFSEWGTSDLASITVEEPEINLTKKCLNESVNLGDLVYYEIFVENTGNITYFDHSNAYGEQFLVIEDIFPEGLKYVGYIINPDKNGNLWEGNYDSIVNTSDRVTIKYKTWDGWEPGSTLNITLIFEAVELGKLVNKAHIHWAWKDWGTKESQEEMELDDEAETVVGPAKFSIDKISNYKEAKVGDIVSFSIVYSNVGNKTITGAYITDKEYSQGLEYYDYSDKEDWTYVSEENTWYYNGKIGAGQSVTLKLFFKALTTGQKSNTAVAGYSGSNETLEDTDTVLIKEGVNGTAGTEGSGVDPTEPEDEPDEEPDDELDTASAVSDSVAAKNTLHETGNPLFVLLISLLTLCFVQRKGKK